MVRTRWAALAVAVGLGTLAGCSTSRPFGSRMHGDPKPAYPDAGVPITDGPIISEGPATFAPGPGPYAPAPTPYAPAPPPPGTILSAPPSVAPATPVPPTGPAPREVPQSAPTARSTKGTT